MNNYNPQFQQNKNQSNSPQKKQNNQHNYNNNPYHMPPQNFNNYCYGPQYYSNMPHPNMPQHHPNMPQNYPQYMHPWGYYPWNQVNQQQQMNNHGNYPQNTQR